jgi:hypothetical protein
LRGGCRQGRNSIWYCVNGMPQKKTLDKAAYTCLLVSYQRLSAQFQSSLSAVTLGYLNGWNAQEPGRNPQDTVLVVTNQSPTLYSFKGAQNLFPAWRNRFLDSLINVYKFWPSTVSVGLKSRFEPPRKTGSRLGLQKKRFVSHWSE